MYNQEKNVDLRWGGGRLFVISTSGSLDLVDAVGGPDWSLGIGLGSAQAIYYGQPGPNIRNLTPSTASKTYNVRQKRIWKKAEKRGSLEARFTIFWALIFSDHARTCL